MVARLKKLTRPHKAAQSSIGLVMHPEGLKIIDNLQDQIHYHSQFPLVFRHKFFNTYAWKLWENKIMIDRSVSK